MSDVLKAPFPAEASACVVALGLLRDGRLVIDSEGFIWRHWAISHGTWRRVTPRRAENVGGKGYLRLTLQLPSGKLGSVMAHRIVWEWHNGPIPEGLQVNHKNLDKACNRLDNLELVTGAGNIQHSYANGRTRPYSVARADPAFVKHRERIKALRAKGLTLAEVSEAEGVSITQAQRVSGTRRPTPRFDPEIKAKALEMIRDGRTQSEVVAATGISRTHLQRLLRRLE